MKALALILAPALLGAQQPMAAFVDTTARPIALEEAVQMAQRNSLQAIQARGTMRTSAAQVRSSFGAFLPNVNVSMGASWSGGQQSRVDDNGNVIPGENPWSYSNGLSMGMTLFDGGRTLYGLSSSRAAADAAEVGEIQTRYTVALTVKQQYFAVLAAREQLAASQGALDQAQQQYRTAKARVQAGSAIISDTLRAIIQVGNARLAMLQAENTLRNSNAALTRTVVSDELVTAQPDTTMDWVNLESEMVQLEALALDAPAVRTAQANLAAARANVRAQRGSWLPSISMSYSRSGSGQDNTYGFGDDPYRYRSGMSFSASFPIFDRFNRERSGIQARVQEENQEAALRDARLRARQDLVNFVGLLQNAEAQIRIQEISVAAAQEDLRVQQMRYELGSSTLLDLLTSQTQLNTARSALIRARFDYRVAKAQLESLLGRDL